jgi:hypothetical protein
MITKSIKHIFVAGILCCGIAAALTACTDTWDEHYDGLGGENVHEGSLWKAIKSDPDLSNFAKVIEGCDYDRALGGSQVFTVFAPTNSQLSSEEADRLVAEFKEQDAARVPEEDNTVLKEFIQNHMALYNYSVSGESNDSIALMNGKYAILTNGTISNVKMLSKNQLYANGVLYKLADKIKYLPNAFEYVRKDPDLDSLRSFMYNPKFYYKEFLPERSVAGSIVNGKTQYLDSVFVQLNTLFSYTGNQISREDSSCIFLAPTNEAWKKMVEEYEPYFDYSSKVAKRDSMVYTNSRLAIINGTVFSRTFNTDVSLKDSAMSENSVMQYNYRRLGWGAPFEYYEYTRPLDQPQGALAQDASNIIQCSNGVVHKAHEWNIDKLMSFHQWLIYPAQTALKEVEKVFDNSTKDSVDVASTEVVKVASDNSYFGKVWDDSYVKFSTNFPMKNFFATFTLKNVLSNIGYDIYLVTAPALAGDSTATEEQRLPTILKCSIKQPGRKEDNLLDDATFSPAADDVDYIQLAENFKFEHCTRDVSDENLQVTMKVELKPSNAHVRKKQYARTMRLDCILLVPHGTLKLIDAIPEDKLVPSKFWGTPGVLMLPHGEYTDRFKKWYMPR